MVGIILAILVGIGLMVGIVTYSQQTATGTNLLLQQLGVTLNTAVYMLFTIIVLFTPIIVVFVPLYIFSNRDKIDTRLLIFAGVYGVMIYYLIITTGVYNYIVDFFTIHYHASFISLTGIKEMFMAVYSYLVGLWGSITDNELVKICRRLF